MINYIVLLLSVMIHYFCPVIRHNFRVISGGHLVTRNVFRAELEKYRLCHYEANITTGNRA